MLATLLSRDETRGRIAAQRARLRFLNGIDWLTRDPKTMVARTPFDIIFEQGKLVVRRYRPSRTRHSPRYATPVLLIPPLMVKPFIYDLYPGRSLVSHLLELGFPTYVVDFGEPDSADACVTLDDYVVDWIPAACSATLADARAPALSLFGYCMGGLFALSHVAANHDERVRNIVAVASPVDTHKMGLLAWVTMLGGQQIETIARHLGNIPGSLSSAALRLLAPTKNITRYADLFMNMWDAEYVNGFDAMHEWTTQFIDYPREAFIQFVRDFMQRNRLVRGKMRFRGRRADLKQVRAAVLAFAGQHDRIAPESSVRAVLGAVGSTDKEVLVVPGGHLGVVAGVGAPAHTWAPAARWLAARSDRRRPAARRRTQPAA